MIISLQTSLFLLVEVPASFGAFCFGHRNHKCRGISPCKIHHGSWRLEKFKLDDVVLIVFVQHDFVGHVVGEDELQFHRKICYAFLVK